MTESRRLVPRQSHTVCRRTRSRTLFLNPSAFVNSVVLYCLGLAQERQGLAVHAATFESTQYHLGITDTAEHSRLADFSRDLNVNVARALNALCAAAHKAFYVRRRVMRSSGRARLMWCSSS